MAYTPLSPQDGYGWFRDATGHVTLLFKNAVKATLSKTGGLTLLDTLTGTAGVFSGAVSAATFAGDVAAYTRKIKLPLNTWTLGGTPPTAASIGTYHGLSFDADAETLHRTFEVPDDWDGASDMALKIAWMNESGTALADTETVIWLGSYRSKASTEVADAGTAAAASATYTQSGAGTDKNLLVTSMTIDYNDTDQPLAAGDSVGFQLSRDFTTDTYGADATAIDVWLEYTSTALSGE